MIHWGRGRVYCLLRMFGGCVSKRRYGGEHSFDVGSGTGLRAAFKKRVDVCILLDIFFSSDVNVDIWTWWNLFVRR